MRSLVISLMVCLLIWGCEDKKKTSDQKTTIPTEKVNDTIETAITEEEISDSVATYPQITQENVVEFLTQYGKDNPETLVRITTQHGAIDIKLYEDTPLHRANFIYLVKQKYFNNTFFHRVVPNFIIQGGNSDTPSTNKKRRVIGKDYLLPAELANARRHTVGTVSGAKEYRENPDKKSAPFEFFIFLGPQSSTGHLNGNYTIFGKVVKGIEVVNTIANLPTDDGDWPQQNVFITAEVIE